MAGKWYTMLLTQYKEFKLKTIIITQTKNKDKPCIVYICTQVVAITSVHIMHWVLMLLDQEVI